MKYLLDTHAILWVAENSPLLTEKVRTIILDKSTEKYVSLVSAWEVAIKLGTHKLNLDGGLQEFFRMIDENGFFVLSLEREYLQLISDLPLHHKDPFDRLLVATAMFEDMTLVTIDENLHKYVVPCLW